MFVDLRIFFSAPIDGSLINDQTMSKVTRKYHVSNLNTGVALWFFNSKPWRCGPAFPILSHTFKINICLPNADRIPQRIIQTQLSTYQGSRKLNEITFKRFKMYVCGFFRILIK